jgi:Putative phage serine protease XkdF
MPMKPGKDESQDDFISRCMSEEKSSFPDQKQRLAVCFSMWRDSKKFDKGEKVMQQSYQVTKIDEELGVIFGWGIVSSVDGEPYFDSQGDWIPDDSMLKASTEFMVDIRIGKEMHAGEQAGTIVHSLPLTSDLAEAFGIECDRTGWIVGFKPHSAELLEKFRSGEYTGFSIGGNRVKDEYVSEE